MNLSSKPCYLDSFSIEFKNDTIHVKLFYTTGSMSSICERVDTLNLGVLDLGSYTIKAEKYYLHISDSIVYNTIYLDVNVGYLSIGHIITNSINLYPNPTNKSLNINMNGIDDVQVIQIHDISGRLISTTETDKNTENHIVLDISTLKNGVYICTLQSIKNNVSMKFIKE